MCVGVGKGGGESGTLTHLDSCPCSDRLSLRSRSAIILYNNFGCVYKVESLNYTAIWFCGYKAGAGYNISQCSQQLNLF